MEENKIYLSELTDIELKALAYDEIIKLENTKNNLNVINQEFLKRQQPIQADKLKNLIR